VALTCNELGVYRKTAFRKNRAAWIFDARTTLEKYGIGWAMWDYSGGFAVVVKQDARAMPNELTVKALGRTMSAVPPQK
jgi:endoglucanase